MRPGDVITKHRVAGQSLDVDIVCKDGPGPGGACHWYILRAGDYSTVLHFQKGPILEVGPNGISCEALLAIVEHRLSCFQAGPFRCHENEDALLATRDALEALKARTKARIARDVEGRMVP